MSSATPSRPASPPWGPILGAGAVIVIVIVAALWLLIRSGAMSEVGEWMHESDAGSLLRHVLESLLLLVCLLLSTAALIYIERKIWGSVQLRRGPNVVGPWGVLQPFADFLKFICKEPVIPASANKGVFVLAPLGFGRARDLRVGGHSGGRRLVDQRHQRRPPLSLRDLLAWASTASSWRAGRPIRNIRCCRRCARPLRWCPTKCRSASSSSRW